MIPPVHTVLAIALVALALAGCAVQMDTYEQTPQGPTGLDVLTARSQMLNGRAPNFDEKRIWENRTEERIAKYLREHPELQQSPRYMEVRFWRQVVPGAPREEVEVLLDEPQEETIDPAYMAVLAERHWDDLGRRVTEAWVYHGWVIYFDEKAVVSTIKRVGRFEVQYE
jgi:hypothetical protein